MTAHFHQDDLTGRKCKFGDEEKESEQNQRRRGGRAGGRTEQGMERRKRLDADRRDV